MRVRSTREQRGWYGYDWANSTFQTSVITVFAGPYLTLLAEAAADPDGFVRPLGIPLRAAAYYPYLVSLSALLQVLAMPVVGALADRTGRRRALLAITAYTGAAAALLIATAEGSAYLRGGGLFVIATVAYACSIVVYNSWLPDIAPPDQRDAVSSRGWALGYLSGGLVLAAHLALVTLADDTGRAVRLAIVSAALWWALFTLVPLATLRDRPGVGGARVSGFRQIAATLRAVARAPATLAFLAAYLLYNDGIQTVIAQSAVYAEAELGLGQSTVVAGVLLVQFVAVAGAYGLGLAAGRVGAKRVVLASLVVWMGVVAAAYVLPAGRPPVFFALAALIGLVLGGTQALSRSLFSQMTPRGREAEYFSLYEVSDRGTSWLGSLLFALALQFTGSYRVAILSLFAFFALGFALLWRTDLRRAVAEAGNAEPARL